MKYLGKSMLQRELDAETAEQPRQWASLPLQTAALLLGYFIAAKLGLMYSVVAGTVSLTWLPSGIALAALRKCGMAVWPGIALAAFLANAGNGLSTPTLLGITLGNTLEAVAAAILLERLGRFRHAMDSLKDVLSFLLVTSIATGIAACLGVGSLAWGHVIPLHDAARALLVWWMGDATGMFIACPFLLVWTASARYKLSARLCFEASALLLSLLGAMWLVFSDQQLAGRGHHPAAFTIFPLSIWGALRFGQRGATAVTLLSSLLMLLATTDGAWPIAGDSATSTMFRWWVFSTPITITGLLLGAAHEERRAARSQLEQQVVRRTQNLLEANRELRKEIDLRQRLEREVIQISEYERKTIGQELHDSLGQHLTGIAFLGQALAERLGGHAPGESRAAQELARLVNEAIVMTRSLARGLWQTPIEAGDLRCALDQLARDTTRRYRVQCEFHGGHGPDVANDLVAINLFRIVQEALGNALRHGKATRISIDLLPQGEGSYQLSIQDNGCGFAADRMDNASGLGLHIMEYRANVIGAALDVRSDPAGGGTYVVVTEKYGS